MIKQAKLYLVRKNTEQLIGPIEFLELMTLIEAMQIGPYDEIASHLSRWVRLDDFSNLSKYYPDVFSYLKEKRINWLTNDAMLSQEPVNHSKFLKIGFLMVVSLFLIILIFKLLNK